MHRDVVGLVAFYLILRLVLTRMHSVAFKADVRRNDPLDRSTHAPSL